MSPEELKKSTEETLKWLGELVPYMPDISFIEPTVQAFALINHENKFTQDILIMIGLAGLIATKARLVDETKFLTITPGEYFQHAYILFKLHNSEEPQESEFLDMMQKLYK
jgi:hypothetical protein